MACLVRLWFFLGVGLCLLSLAAGADRYVVAEESQGRVVCTSSYRGNTEGQANVAGVRFQLPEIPAERMVLHALRIQLLADYRYTVPDYNCLAAYVLDVEGRVLGKSQMAVPDERARVMFRFEDNPVVVQKGVTYYVYFIKGLQEAGARRYWDRLLPGRKLGMVDASYGKGKLEACKGNHLRVKVMMGQDPRTAGQWGFLKVSSKVGEPVSFEDGIPLMGLELEKASADPMPGEIQAARAPKVVRMPGAESIMLRRLEEQLPSIKDEHSRKWYTEHGLGALRKVTEGGDVNAITDPKFHEDPALTHLVLMYGGYMTPPPFPEGLWYLLLHGADVSHVNNVGKDVFFYARAWFGRSKWPVVRLLEVCRELKGKRNTESLPLEAERQELLEKMAPDWGRAFFDPAAGIPFAELRQRLVDNAMAVPHHEMFTFTPESGRLFRVAGRACALAQARVSVSGNPDTPSCFVAPHRNQGEVVFRSAHEITILWEGGAKESFVRQANGCYYRKDISNVEPESAAYREWSRELLKRQPRQPRQEVVVLQRPEGRQEYRIAGSLAKEVRSGREVRVVERDATSLTLQWASGQPETYVLQKDGSYSRGERVALPSVAEWNKLLQQQPDNLAYEELVLVAPTSYSKLLVAGQVAYLTNAKRPWVDVLSRDAASVVLRRYYSGGQVYVKQKEPGYFFANYYTASCSDKTWRAPREDKRWKQEVAEVKRLFRDKPEQAPHETLDFWVEERGKPQVAELWVSGGVAYLPQSGEVAEIVEWDRRHLVLAWEGGKQERYTRQGDGAYGATPRKRVSQAERPGRKLTKLKERLRDAPEKVPHERVSLVVPVWPNGSSMLRVAGEAACRPLSRGADLASVSREGDVLRVFWEQWGEDVFRKREDGLYYQWDSVPRTALGNGEYRGDARYGMVREFGRRIFQTSPGGGLWLVPAGGVSLRLAGETPVQLEALEVELASEACRKSYGKVGAYVLDADGTVLDKTDEVEWVGAKLRFFFPDKRAALQPNLSYMVYFAKEIQAGDAFSKLRVGSRVDSPDSSVSGFREKAKGNHLLLRVVERKDPYTASAWGLLAPSRQRGEIFFRYNAPLMEVVTSCPGEAGEGLEELLERLKRNPDSVPHTTLRLKNTAWGWAGASRTAELYLVGDAVCMARTKDTGEVLFRDAQNLVLHWPHWDSTELYTQQADGVFVRQKREKGRVEMLGGASEARRSSTPQESRYAESAAHESVELVNHGWGTDRFYLADKGGRRASGRQEAATVAREDDRLEISWSSYPGKEVYRRLADGRYYIWDSVPGQAEKTGHFRGVVRCQYEEKEGKRVGRTVATGTEWVAAAGGVAFRQPQGGAPCALESLAVRVWKESLRETADYKRLGAYVLDAKGRLLDKTRKVVWKGDQVRFVFSNRAAHLKPGKAYAVYFVKGINSIYADDYYSRLKVGMVVAEPESSVSGLLEQAKGNHLMLRVVEGVDPNTAPEWGLLEPSRQRGALAFRYDTPLMEVTASPLSAGEAEEDDGDGEPLWLYVGLPLAGLAGTGVFFWLRWRHTHRVEKPAGW